MKEANDGKLSATLWRHSETLLAKHKTAGSHNQEIHNIRKLIMWHLGVSQPYPKDPETLAASIFQGKSIKNRQEIPTNLCYPIVPDNTASHLRRQSVFNTCRYAAENSCIWQQIGSDCNVLEQRVLTFGLTFQENRQAWGDMSPINSVTLSHTAMNKTSLQSCIYTLFTEAIPIQTFWKRTVEF